jgi:hypothetical protein
MEEIKNIPKQTPETSPEVSPGIPAPSSQEGFTEPPEKKSKGKIIAVITMVIILLLTVAAFGYFFMKSNREKQDELNRLKSQLEDMEKEADNLASSLSQQEAQPVQSEIQPETVADEYAGWNTYINEEIGYQLKYPTDWTIKETDEHSELIGEDVKYITVNSPGGKYFLYWGIKHKNDDFYISDRTGMGAGDIKKAGTVTILGTENEIKKLVYEGKVKEYFFTWSGGGKSADGNYQFSASLGYSGSNYDSLNMEDVEEFETAKKILESVEII